ILGLNEVASRGLVAVERSPLRVPNLAGPEPAEARPVDSRPVSQSPDPARTTTPGLVAEGLTSRLTARQLQVVAMLTTDLTAREIAEHLGISPNTMYRHVEHAKRRLDVRTRIELVALA